RCARDRRLRDAVLVVARVERHDDLAVRVELRLAGPQLVELAEGRAHRSGEVLELELDARDDRTVVALEAEARRDALEERALGADALADAHLDRRPIGERARVEREGEVRVDQVVAEVRERADEQLPGGQALE